MNWLILNQNSLYLLNHLPFHSSVYMHIMNFLVLVLTQKRFTPCYKRDCIIQPGIKKGDLEQTLNKNTQTWALPINLSDNLCQALLESKKVEKINKPVATLKQLLFYSQTQFPHCKRIMKETMGKKGQYQKAAHQHLLLHSHKRT